MSETYLSFIEKKPILLDLLKLLSVLFIQQYISLSFAFLLKSFRILCIQICTQLSKNLIRNHRSTWNTSSIFTSLFWWFLFFLFLLRCWWIGDNDLKQKTKTTTATASPTTQSHWNLSIGREALWHSMLYYYAVKFIYVMQLKKKKNVNAHCHKRYDRKTAPESFNTTLVYEFVIIQFIVGPSHSYSHSFGAKPHTKSTNIIQPSSQAEPCRGTYEQSSAKIYFRWWNEMNIFFFSEAFRSYSAMRILIIPIHTQCNAMWCSMHTEQSAVLCSVTRMRERAQCARARFSFKNDMMPNHDHCIT